MIQRFRSATRGSLFYPIWSIPVALLALTILCYGIRALSLGFFWDDWPYLWFFYRLGPTGILNAFADDRPFLSSIYILTLSILGHSTVAWQTFALFTHWLYSLGFWLMATLAWPKRTHQTTGAAFLFAVYPGFTGHWISVIYGQAFALFSLVFFSISLTLWLARRRGSLAKVWLVSGTVLALLLSAFTMYSTEYFFGVELLRPILLWIVLAAPSVAVPSSRWAAMRDQFFRVLRWWLPYLALMISFVIWRGFIHQMQGYKLSALQAMSQSPISTLPALAIVALGDFIEASLAAWGQTLQLSGILETQISSGFRWLQLTLLAAILVTLYLSRLCPRQVKPTTNRLGVELTGWPWPAEAITTGSLALLVAGLPFWATSLPMRMGFPQDRFSMMLSIGVCLILSGLIDAVAKDQVRKASLIGLLVALAVGFQFHTSQTYQQDWRTFRDFYWQLTWRAPEIKEDTLLVTAQMPFRYYEDDSLSAPLNWVYDPEGQGSEMKYLLYDINVRQSSFPSMDPGHPIERDFRATQFQGSTSQVLAFYYAPPGCLKVLDPVYDADLNLLPKPLLQALPLSNPRQQVTDSQTPATPPGEMFGEEPKHRWCYFYQKAELARQNEDWQAFVTLKNESIGKGFRPEDASEYLPFIEGFARLYFLEDAHQLTRSAYQSSPALRPALCAVWQRTVPDKSILDPGSLQEYEAVQGMLKCTTP